MLTEKDIRRVTVSLIRSEQERLINAGKMHGDCHIDAQTGPLQGKSLLDLSVDEDSLGFDSLARLALVEEVNRFFGLSETGVEDYLLVHRTLADWVDLIGEHFRRVGSKVCFTFGSSGSTGAPAYSAHGWTSLNSEIQAHLKGAFADFAPQRVLSAVPVHHIYGFLWGVLIPAALNVDALDLPAGLPGPVRRNATAGDLIINTPFGLEQMVSGPASVTEPLPKGVAAVSSGGPTTLRTWEAGQALGLMRMIEIYGASETGGLGWRDDAMAPFQLLSDIDGIGETLTREGKTLTVQDNLAWLNEGQFRVEGRKDKRVQVGGTNVSLDEVRRALVADDGVADAAVRLDGERLKAFIVPRESEKETDQLEAVLRQRLRTLPAVARPDRFTFGPALPRNASGKLQDWGIPNMQ